MYEPTSQCFCVICPVIFASKRLSSVLKTYGMFVSVVCRERSDFVWGPAVKNHKRWRMRRPPNVPSYELFTSSIGSTCPAKSDFSVQFGFVSESRIDPEKSLPPDFVIVLTTPPVKRPYSAEMPPLRTVVSWIASSM